MFAPALGQFDVRLVYYIRRQDDWLISAWKQWGVKAGKRLDDFCLEGTRTRYPAFTVCLQRWEKHAASVQVKPLHKSALFAGSVTEDFARALGLPREGLEHPGVSNASFDASVLEVLWRNPFLFQHRDDDRMFRFLEAFLSKEIEPLRTQLSPETQTQLRSFFEAENRALHARHFADTDFDTVFGPARPTGMKPPCEMELLVRFLGVQLRGIMGMQERVDGLQERVDSLERQLHSLQRPATTR
jgi:hypothetical protein